MSDERRIELVNKLVDLGLDEAEHAELDRLQKEKGRSRMNKVWVVTMGTKFPKCVQGIFPSKQEAKDAMKLGAHKFLRGPFEMDLGSVATICAPVRRKEKIRYYFAIRDDNPEDTRSFELPDDYTRRVNPNKHTGKYDTTGYIVESSLESPGDAEMKARKSWWSGLAERKRKRKAEQRLEDYKEVNRWEEIARVEANLERLKREARTTSLENALAIYNAKHPS
jgi:hypothetical protein